MVAGMIDTPPATAANGSVVAPAAPNAAAPSATEAQTAELQRRAGEGDEEAKASLYDMRVTEDAKVEAQTAALGEARKDVMGKLFQTPALTNLSAAEQGRLVTALATGGETAFMNAAMEIGVQRTGGGAPAAAPPAQVAAAAAGYQAVQSAQAQGAPVIPAAAAPVDGGAPINVTEGKSATDVLDDFFSSQGQ